MSKRDYYEILGISKNANQAEIKKSYRKSAMKFHPDHNKASNAEEKFKEINEAYEILSNQDKKAKYDQFGHAAFEHGNNQGFSGFSNNFGGFGDLNDIFSSFFGGRSRRSNAPMQGNDFQFDIKISFLDSVFGKTIVEKLDKYENGVKVKKETEIQIPAGIKDGQSILVKGFGGQGYNGGPNGNLYIHINILPHHHYIRQDYDIHINIPISFVDIMQENELEVPTPYGNKIIKLKRSYKSGTILKISKKGFKSIHGSFIGDLKIHIEIYVPKFSYFDEKKILEVTKNIKNKKHERWLKGFKE